jgi:predicted neutral ceramidase superfamily lipid hydrolase
MAFVFEVISALLSWMVFCIPVPRPASLILPIVSVFVLMFVVFVVIKPRRQELEG